jgi:hypothetical protein
MELLEKELRAAVSRIYPTSFTYTRWFTTEWPDDNWSLRLDGKKIRGASHANSARRPTGQRPNWSSTERGRRPVLRGRIAAVVKPGPDTPPP